MSELCDLIPAKEIKNDLGYDALKEINKFSLK